MFQADTMPRPGDAPACFSSTAESPGTTQLQLVLQRLLIVLVCLVSGILPAAATNFADAARNYDGGRYTAAAQQWKHLAQQGDRDAQVALASLLSSGPRWLRDDEQAIHWLTLAARAGDSRAQLQLGNRLLTGQGVVQDVGAGLEWLRLSASGGEAWACAALKDICPPSRTTELARHAGLRLATATGESAGVSERPLVRPEVLRHHTRYSFPVLLERLEKAVTAEGMAVVTRASASAGATARGLRIRGNAVLGVFRNDYAVRMLDASIAAGIEAPLRFYVVEEGDGTATLSYERPTSVFAPYRADALASLARELDEIWARIAASATAPE